MVDAVYLAYWSVNDPLFRSQSLPILRGLARHGWRFAAVTFEQPEWRLARAEERELQRELAREGLVWYPLRYHKRPPVVATGLDIAAGTRAALALAVRLGARAFHGRGTVPGAMALLAAAVTRRRFFYDADGPLSQEYVDAGIWDAGSLPHRMTRWFEGRSFRRADAVAVLTERRRLEVQGQTRSRVAVLPCAVALDRFADQREAGRRLKQELRLTGSVLVYAGKAGGWYLTDTMFDFAAEFQKVAGALTVLVLTSQEPSRFLRPAADRSVHCVVRHATHREVPGYLAAADAGLSFVLEAPSKTACSPVKNGEYLAAGLPIVTTPAVGDYSDWIATDRVGIVARPSAPDGLRRAATELQQLLCDATLADRCRAAARERVSLEDVVVPRYQGIYERMLGHPAGV